MALFCGRVPRLLVLATAVAAFCMLPPELLGRGPDVCLWRHLLGVSSCPACGSTRALAAFFHGHWAQALAYNRNVLVTAPLLTAMLVRDAVLAFSHGQKLPRTLSR